MTPHTGGAARGSVGTAVITGGASGIGLATARRLRAAGMHVLIADVDQAAATRAARDVGCESTQLDVTDWGAWKRLRDHLDGRRCPLEALVLNAGRAGGPADIMDVEVGTTTDRCGPSTLMVLCSAFARSVQPCACADGAPSPSPARLRV